MSRYTEYLNEINERKTQGLHPKPIDDSALLNEIISHIKDKNNNNRAKSLEFFIYYLELQVLLKLNLNF